MRHKWNITKIYSEQEKTYKTELSAKTINRLKSLTVHKKTQSQLSIRVINTPPI